ncbi:hypothetical protein [Rhodoblastus sp.]|uniref:hypothetical protein n=1 Tax=Rhodoblastus sp. TaxID=1962975 RepID=UPI003F98DB3D
MRSHQLVFVCFAMCAQIANAETPEAPDCMAVEEFFQKLGTVMAVTAQCPDIKTNMKRIRAEAAALGIPLGNLASYKACPGSLVRGTSSGKAMAAMFNDSSGSQACEKAVTRSNELNWESFIEK